MPIRKGNGIRAAIIGSAGTGKSTLSRALSAELGLSVSPDWTRSVLAEGLTNIDRRSQPKLLAEVTEKVLVKKIAFEQGTEAFVADRSSLDSAIFWTRWLSDWADEARNQDFLERCRAHASRYTSIILLPFGEIALIADGVRTARPSYQWGMHLLFRGLLDDWKIKFLALPDEMRDLTERVHWIRERL